MKVIFLILFVFYISKTVGYSFLQPKEIKGTNESLIYSHDVKGSVYSKFSFIKDSRFDLPFNYVNEGIIGICIADDNLSPFTVIEPPGTLFIFNGIGLISNQNLFDSKPPVIMSTDIDLEYN
ncbi:hypothetical protein ACTA71_007631 [Dictyostelium dimigraforme]